MRTAAKAKVYRSGRYDVILHNGAYRVDIRLKPGSSSLGREEGPIRHALRLGGRYRLPWLGKLWRNAWAKKRGAILIRPMTLARTPRVGRS